MISGPEGPETPVNGGSGRKPQLSKSRVSRTQLGSKRSARSFSDRSLLAPSWGHGRLRLRVMDVCAQLLVFPGLGGSD